MSKSVAITEGDRAYRFGKCSYLRTNKQGGGYVIWVPEDDRDTTTKHITKDGTYKVSDEKKTGGDSYYGYSEVTVNVPDADKAIGKKPDGNTHVVTPDPDNDDLLGDKIIPDYIKIITPPDQLTYSDGEFISLYGAVVKAYQGDGNLWVADGYSDGVIPNGELYLHPTKATKGEGSHAQYSTGNGFSVDGVTVDGEIISQDRVGCAAYIGTTSPTDADKAYFAQLAGNAYIGKRNAAGDIRDVSVLAWENLQTFVIRTVRVAVIEYSDGYLANLLATKDGGGPLGTRGQYTVSAGSYTYQGKTVWWSRSGYPPDVESVIPHSHVNYSYSSFSNARARAAAWAMIYGSEQVAGDSNVVTVSWHRPDDDKELADTFNIAVL